MADMRAKKRNSPPPRPVSGRGAVLAKYTSAEISVAASLLAAGLTQNQVAAQTGISQGHVSRISRGLVSLE